MSTRRWTSATRPPRPASPTRRPTGWAFGNRRSHHGRDDDLQQRDADPRAVPRSQAGDDRGVFHLRAPDLPGVRVRAGHEAHGEGVRPAHDRARLDRVHVRREHDLLHDAVGGAVDAHAARVVGLGGARMAAGLKALMKKGKMKSEPINVIAFCGDGGGADMGLGAISATLTHKEYNSLILTYD